MGLYKRMIAIALMLFLVVVVFAALDNPASDINGDGSVIESSDGTLSDSYEFNVW